MSIKLKLIVSFSIMVLVPAFSILAAALVILASQVGALERDGWIPKIISERSEAALSVFADLEKTVLHNPDKLMDKKFLAEIDEKLDVANTGIFVDKGGEMLYGSELLDNMRSSEELLQYMQYGTEKHRSLVINRKSYNAIKRSFIFSDNSKGTLMLLTDLSVLGDFLKTYFSSLLKATVIILLLTNGILTFFVSRGFIKPLNVLMQATEQIKKGNLDFDIKVKSKDEIGKLCIAFEEMRIRLKESLEMQRQYEKNRKELISNISHDLKTPITAIKGYVKGIIDGVPDSSEKMNRYLKTVYTKTNDMDRLVEDLFLFSKFDLKKVPFNFEKVDVGSYFEDCVEELRADLEDEGIEIDFEAGVSERTFVLLDREKLKRVIMNIVGNAVKYMDKQHNKIVIRIQEKQDTIQVQFEDNGKGIKQEALPYIFEKFYREDTSRNSSTGGSGLGLAIAKQIVEGHSGRIWAESVRGEGTSIYFTLSKADCQPEFAVDSTKNN